VLYPFITLLIICKTQAFLVLQKAQQHLLGDYIVIFLLALVDVMNGWLQMLTCNCYFFKSYRLFLYETNKVLILLKWFW